MSLEEYSRILIIVLLELLTKILTKIAEMTIWENELNTLDKSWPKDLGSSV